MSLNLVDIYGEIEGDYKIIKVLPFKLTNWNMLNAIFPEMGFYFENNKVYFCLPNGYDINWLTAPYKAESEK